jgi:bifunctional non-homologous end joining protein LigD
MNLDEYIRKRQFSKTPEPKLSPPRNHNSDSLLFVIQKHQATHLHYDLRLELDGVLKSWAIPKGPSLNPTEKRMAVEVEDHPFDYRNFEGIIPHGNYGAGTVMIWDEGTYSTPGGDDLQNMQQKIRESLQKGNLYFVLKGKKLNGAFHLIRTKLHSQDKNWLLIKKSDSFSTQSDVLSENRSARTGKTLEEISVPEIVSQISPPELSDYGLTEILRQELPKGPITPMMAQLKEKPFDKDNWIFEIKWDGYRAIAKSGKGDIRLYSRRANSFLNDYPSIVADLSKISFEAIFDGEIVALDNQGRADFSTLQNYRRTGTGLIIYYVFDLLYLDHYDLKNLPLFKRKSILRQVLPPLTHIHYCEHIEKEGTAFFCAAKENQLEGIVAKNKDSPYIPGIRSAHWQKIKITMNQEVVVGGYTQPRGGRSGIGSLLVGVYNSTDLIYVGNVGGGFSDDELTIVKKDLESIIIDHSPFKSVVPGESEVTWVRPELVCEVRFAEWTPDGLMRQPIYKGFRTDILPKNVKRETVSSLPTTNLKLTQQIEQDEYISIDNNTLKLTNIYKPYWPSQGITKGDMLRYYREVSPWILPHLINRLQSLHRYPDGIEGKHFYHKDIESVPEWVTTFSMDSDVEDKKVRYLLCQNEAMLIYMVNLGTIEINPWISRISSLNNPDYMVIDLDPLNCPFKWIVKTALVVHEILRGIRTPHFVKTSGATGIHIYVPLGAMYTYEQSRQFAMLICALVNRRIPEYTSMERLPQNRDGKVYLDYLQNIKGKTIVAPYSLRPMALAPVSTPLHWEELNDDLTPDQFTISNTKKRLELYGDLWKPVLEHGIDMQKSLNLLSNFFDS